MATQRLHSDLTRRPYISILFAVCFLASCTPDAPPAPLRPELAPIIVILDDRSGTIDLKGIVKPDAVFYNDVATSLQDNCPGGILAVVLCGNPKPASKSSLRFDADTFRMVLPGDGANHEDRYHARLKNEAAVLARNQRRAAFISLIDQHIIRYEPNGADVTYLDDALLRVRRIIDSPIHAQRPKLVVVISDGINENSQATAIPFTRKFIKDTDDQSLSIVLNSWENPDISIFEHEPIQLQRTESLPDTKRCIAEFISQNKP